MHADSASVKDPVRRQLAATIETIVRSCPELARPRYVPTFWAALTWPNLLLLMAKQSLEARFRSHFRRDLLTMEDGGRVAVDWAEAGASLPAEAPIVIFLHTVTGSASSSTAYTRAATERGWRSCVFTRRGHGGLRLGPAARVNLMGDAADTAAMVAHVRRLHPASSYLAMVGISAGSGLLITYLGQQAAATPVQAAVSLCPAWDVSQVELQTNLCDDYTKFYNYGEGPY